MSQFFCLSCRATFKNNEEFDKHPCNPIFKMREGTITVEFDPIKLKRTRWGRFIDMVLSFDISWGLAFMGLAILNAILIPHVGLTFKESLGESLALGFAIPRLLK